MFVAAATAGGVAELTVLPGHDSGTERAVGAFGFAGMGESGLSGVGSEKNSFSVSGATPVKYPLPPSR
ncbi:MAG: hypothetical protein MST10_01720 [Lentisphaeria bacterium]|nr:hypothetical protein [Lentisphaeria bacterium]